MNAISRSSEYAIRALTYMAREGDPLRFRLVREMAEELGIRAPFLSKILQPLVSRGLLESQRGRTGGFRLAHAPRDVSLFQIVDAEDHLGGPRLCLLGQAECTDERACPLHAFWREASESFLAELSGTSLADLVAFCEESPDSGYPSVR